MADAQDRPVSDQAASQPAPASPPATGEDREHLEKLEEALFEIRRVIAGQESMLERLLLCLLAGGHLLIEGVPGLAKTLAIKSTAAVLGGSFSRIQFTPDLVPSDLVGTRIFRPDKHEFDTELGPVFCNFLLADEINRAPAKVQSALLEVMQERQVTIGHTSHLVPDPFLVLATQNPIESEGTYPLPEAQVDRFMLKVLVDYPAHDEELTVVARSLEPAPVLHPVLSIEQLKKLQAMVARVFVDPALVSWVVDLATATRKPNEVGIPSIAPYVSYGASPRGPISVVAAARALAVLRDRDYVLPADVEAVVRDAFRHRLVLSYQALAEEVTADWVLDQVLAAVQPPQIDLGRPAAAAA
jgi:MoxR-like ATPase